MADKFVTFMGRVTGITKSIRRLISEVVALYGIKRAYAIPVYFLYKNGPLSAARLSRLCGEDKANLSRTLRSLEADGYVVMEERGSSRARPRIALSPEGERIGRLLTEKSSELVALATDAISPEEISAMHAVLHRIDENLEGALGAITE